MVHEMDPKGDQTERRENPRTAIQIWAEERQGGSTYFHLLSNLSVGGFLIEKKIPFPPNSEVHMEFSLHGSDEKIKIKGRVVDNYKDADSNEIGPGVKFVDMEEAVAQKIRQYLESVK
ncbi:MAG: PilZ domain-containing protein [Desulfobacterales bacterium]|nr:PilZ domain-containing protein [Desulfobacterales bacterium]